MIEALRPSQVTQYLRRLGVAAVPAPNADTLRDLHLRHLRAVPFECLDVWRGVPLSLDPDQLVEKIVTRRRGGFCYELNSLFARLLAALGFEVELLAAQVVNNDQQLGPPFDHMVLRVGGAERVLCDVGFGRSFLVPLPLSCGEVCDASGAYRLRREDDDHQWLELMDEDRWAPMHLLDERPRSLQEFRAMFEFHQSDPGSPFPRTFLVTRATRDGRRTVRDFECTETVAEVKIQRTLADERERAAYVREHFEIDVDALS